MEFKETEILEFKKSTSEIKEAIISIVAILNKHHKGELYFGIKNNGEVIGQIIGKDTIRDISRAVSNAVEPKTYPTIEQVNIKGKTCIKVDFNGDDVSYYAYGRVYMRVGDEDKKLGPREIEKVIVKKHRNNFRWEIQISDNTIKDISIKTVKDYVKRANLAGRIDYKYDNIKNVLRKLGLIRGNKFLNAAQVLFSRKNNLEVQFAVFAGIDKVTFLDIKQFKSDIFNLLEKSEEYIKERINWHVEIKGLQRQEIPEVPIDAIREALVNSLCHRDYFAPESNKIAIFKNRIEIWNPGNFPEGLTPQDFIKGKEQSVLKNPLIADVLYKSKEIEKWGSGLKRIYDECRINKSKIEFKILKTGFMVVFYRKEISKDSNVVSGRLTQKPPRNRPETAQKIIEVLLKNPYTTRQELANIVGLTEDSIKHRLVDLKNKNIIKRIGADRGGYWKVVKKCWI